jgi:hypothetical protein
MSEEGVTYSVGTAPAKYLELGFLAIENEDYQEAINIFQKALETNKSAKIYSGLGEAFFHAGDMPTARWAFYKALELQSDDAKLSSYLDTISNFHKEAPPRNGRSVFQVRKERIGILEDEWTPFFIKGINIGLGLPGFFPGEFAVQKNTYAKWFNQISDLGINTIRVYTVHPPSFYQALHEHNEKSSKKLYLLQGVWAELPGSNDFSEESYMSQMRINIENAVDAAYGNARLPEKPGHAHGEYLYDVSAYTIGFIIGREWESCAVREFNEHRNQRITDYAGRFLSVEAGTPFEVWAAGICDYLQTYVQAKYTTTHPVSIINWPTLDPLSHFSESDYQKELRLQGIIASICANEDAESLDLAKITATAGSGFFVTYHAYPYYPDFMNNDYLNRENMYRAYLNALKDHHADHPVLIAEFGVPSSREICHWHRDGWHHGGHNEIEQGKINALLMKTIHDAGMAGSVLFSWFDEWFKRNWLFMPYELPADRNHLWFNLQDAEQNYGLLAMYPNYPDKKVSLTGNVEEWKEAAVLSNDDSGLLAFNFQDGFDKSRSLRKIAVMHDEGFLYLLLETDGEIDFENAHYLIGLDTCNPRYGEFQLPCNTLFRSPVGLKFLFHLTGIVKSRVLVCRQYDKYFNKEADEIWPGVSDQAEWVLMFNRTNTRRISKDGSRFFPSHVFPMSNLRHGSLDPENARYDSLADFFATKNMIEIRIPWGLIQFTDPSSKTVLWKKTGEMTAKSEGVRIIAASYKPEKDSLSAQKTGGAHNLTDYLPRQLTPQAMPVYTWSEWNRPIYHSYLKKSYFTYQEALAGITERQ